MNSVMLGWQKGKKKDITVLMIPFVFHFITLHPGVSSEQDTIPESVSFFSFPECESGYDSNDEDS